MIAIRAMQDEANLGGGAIVGVMLIITYRQRTLERGQSS